MDITVRPPRMPDEAKTIAELIRMSGDGLFEFLYGDRLGVGVNSILEECVTNAKSPLHHSHCTVAEVDGHTAAALISLPSAVRHVKNVDWIMAGVRHLDFRSVLRLLARLIPLARYTPAKGSYNIQNLAVFPQFQRQGVATRLLNEADNLAAENGFSSVSIEVWKDNTPALRLYQHTGFSILREIKRVPKILNHEAYLQMDKTLNEP